MLASCAMGTESVGPAGDSLDGAPSDSEAPTSGTTIWSTPQAASFCGWAFGQETASPRHFDSTRRRVRSTIRRVDRLSVTWYVHL